jgi:hypothetical protein
LQQELVHLPQLLCLASFIVANFNRKFDMGEANTDTVETFLLTHCADDYKGLRPVINIFFALLNRLKVKLYAHKW